jgi:hypothetical protein
MEVAEMGTAKWLRRSAPIAAAVAIIMVVLAGSAGATGRYTDKTGDGGAALDIAGAEVSSDSAGLITFRIHIPNMTPTGLIGLFIDSDANSATGNVDGGGVEYSFVVDPAERAFDFARWNGSDWDFNTPSSTVRVSAASSGVLISVNRSELGNTNQLNFWVLTAVGDAAPGSRDDAPDEGLWNYDLTVGGPDIREVLVQTTPATGPRVGKPFAVKVAGIKLPQTNASDAVQPDSSKCTAKLAGRTLAGSGTGGCTFRIPRKKSKGKQLVVTVSVAYEGATKSIQLPFKVRK